MFAREKCEWLSAILVQTQVTGAVQPLHALSHSHRPLKREPYGHFSKMSWGNRKGPDLAGTAPPAKATNESRFSPNQTETAWCEGWGVCSLSMPCLLGWYTLCIVARSQKAASVAVCIIHILCVYVLCVKAYNSEQQHYWPFELAMQRCPVLIFNSRPGL